MGNACEQYGLDFRVLRPFRNCHGCRAVGFGGDSGITGTGSRFFFYPACEAREIKRTGSIVCQREIT